MRASAWLFGLLALTLPSKENGMMKILHTADWHLGNSFHGHDRTAEHRHFLDWLLGVLRDRMPDALVVAGDVFDSPNPSAASEKMLYDFLLESTRQVPGLQVVLTAGNHDSAGRMEAPAALLKTRNIYVRGTARRREEDGLPDFDHYLLPLSRRTGKEAELVCIALPYLRSCDYPAGLSAEEGLRYYYENCLRRLRKSAFRGLPVISVAHFYAAGAEVCAGEHSERLVVGGQDCVDAGVAGKDVCYVALGHIHKAQRVAGRDEVRYAGSALPLSFSEKRYGHGAQWVEIGDDGAVTTSRLAYEPLRRLVSVPESGAASPQEVLEALEGLPRRGKGDDGEAWPYLEIRVLERQPEPTFVNEVNRALEDRAVRLCRIVRELPASERGGDERSIELLRRISPLEMARHAYEKRYGAPFPPGLEERFRRAEAAASARGEEL